MDKQITRHTGNFKLSRPEIIGIVLLAAVFLGMVTAKMGISIGGLILTLPFAIIYIAMVIRNPVIAYYSAIIMGFFLLGLSRYIRGVAFGIFIDAALVLSVVGIFFRDFPNKVDWKPLNKDIMILTLLWFLYGLMEIVNPELRSIGAYIAGFRGLILKIFLAVPLTLMLITTKDRVNLFFIIWGSISLLASLKGFIQLNIGLDWAEQGWLDRGAAETHVLFGKLRVFSFYSDAGQFGANQAYTFVVFSIMSLGTKAFRTKIFYLIVAAAALYGMFISGTRGSMAVIAGFGMYFIHRKNIPMLITGFILAVSVFVFFSYTTIGNQNPQIRRMRTAFDPNDASLQVRLENQRRLKVYMASRPIGGSLGHGGVKAQQYAPNAFLSNVATDSWYVLVWVEMGIVGLVFHLFMLFYVLGKGSYLIMFSIRDRELWHQMSGLSAGLFGIMIANYGNAVIGSHPTALVAYTAMALMLNADTIDKNIRIDLRKKSIFAKFIEAKKLIGN